MVAQRGRHQPAPERHAPFPFSFSFSSFVFETPPTGGVVERTPVGRECCAAQPSVPGPKGFLVEYLQDSLATRAARDANRCAGGKRRRGGAGYTKAAGSETRAAKSGWIRTEAVENLVVALGGRLRNNPRLLEEVMLDVPSKSRSIVREWRSIRFRLAPRTHRTCHAARTCAPRGPSARVVPGRPTKSRKRPTRHSITALFQGHVRANHQRLGVKVELDKLPEAGRVVIARRLGVAKGLEERVGGKNPLLEVGRVAAAAIPERDVESWRGDGFRLDDERKVIRGHANEFDFVRFDSISFGRGRGHGYGFPARATHPRAGPRLSTCGA